MKSFDEYFEGYKNYDDGGKLDQGIVADAKKVFETLKTPKAIDQYYKADYEKQQQMVKGLDDEHSGFSFFCVCSVAYKYASYTQKCIEEATQQNISEPKSEQITKQDLVSALDGVSYDKSVVLDMIDKHPDMVKTLVNVKDKEGKPLFDALAIDDVLFNCKNTIENHPDRITAVLNNPEEIASISNWKSKGAGLWRAVAGPLSSTVERNPEAFGIKPKSEQVAEANIENKSNTNKITNLRKKLVSKDDKTSDTGVEKNKKTEKMTPMALKRSARDGR